MNHFSVESGRELVESNTAPQKKNESNMQFENIPSQEIYKLIKNKKKRHYELQLEEKFNQKNYSGSKRQKAILKNEIRKGRNKHRIIKLSFVPDSIQ